MATQYVQTSLRKGNYIDTAWLEDKRIKPGSNVEIKNDDGTKEIWTVEAVYGRVSKAEMLVQRDSHKDHRKATDI